MCHPSAELGVISLKVVSANEIHGLVFKSWMWVYSEQGLVDIFWGLVGVRGEEHLLETTQVGPQLRVLGRDGVEFGRMLGRSGISCCRDACGVHEVGHDPVDHDITGVEVMFVLLEVQAGNVNGVVARGRMGRCIRWTVALAGRWLGLVSWSLSAMVLAVVGGDMDDGRDDLVSKRRFDRWTEGRELLRGVSPNNGLYNSSKLFFVKRML